MQPLLPHTQLKPRYDVSLFNPAHLRKNEQDASRGVKQPALKQARIVLCRPHAKSKGGGIQWRALQMNVSGHLSPAHPLFPPSEVQADCEGSPWHRSTHSCLLQPPKRPLKSHQFIRARRVVSDHNNTRPSEGSQSREDTVTAKVPLGSQMIECSSPWIIID